MASTTSPPAVPQEQADDEQADDAGSGGALPTAVRVRRHLRNALGWVLAGILLLAIGYGGGRLHAWYDLRASRDAWQEQLELERSRAASAEEALRVQLSRKTAQLESANAERAALGELSRVYESYRYIERALDALDARNFGIAESRVRQAEQRLGSTTAAGAEVDEVLRSLSELHVSVASDLAPQRATLRALSQRLSTLIDRMRESLDAPKASR